MEQAQDVYLNAKQTTRTMSDETDIPSERARNGKDESDNEIGYMADNGSFFMERRESFFYWNFFVYVLAVDFFAFIVYEISNDYAAQKEGPPTSSRLRIGHDEKMPGVLICNFDKEAPLDQLFSLFENSTGVYEVEFQQHTCREFQGLTSGPHCYMFDEELPAFETKGRLSRKENLQ